MRRINRELNMVNFLRKSIMLTSLINSITTPDQRLLLRRQFKLMLGHINESTSTEDSDES